MVNSVSHHLLKQASFLHFTWHNINHVPRVHSLPLSKTLGTRLTSRHTCSPLPQNHAISHTNELLVFTVWPSKIKIVLWEDMSLAAMNSLYKNQALAEQNHSSRQSRCVTISNRHVHFLSLFVTCYECFIARNVGSAATGKVKTYTDTVLGLL